MARWSIYVLFAVSVLWRLLLIYHLCHIISGYPGIHSVPSCAVNGQIRCRVGHIRDQMHPRGIRDARVPRPFYLPHQEPNTSG